MLITVVLLVLLIVALLWLRRDRDRAVRSALPGPVDDIRAGLAHADRAAQLLDPGAILQSVELRCRFEDNVLQVDSLTYTFYRRVPPRWSRSKEYYRCWHVELDNQLRELRGAGPGVFDAAHTAELKRATHGTWPGKLDLAGIKLTSQQIPEILSEATGQPLPPAVDPEAIILTLFSAPDGRPQWSIHCWYPDGSLRFTVIDAGDGVVIRESWDSDSSTDRRRGRD